MDDEPFLDTILQKITGNPPERLLSDEVNRLTTFFLPSQSPSLRSKAYLLLSAICEQQRASLSVGNADDNLTADAVLHQFLPAIESKIADVEQKAVLEALSFTVALFTVDRLAASSLFIRDGFQDSVMDSLELFESSVDISYAVASVLSLACGHKSCNAALSPRCLPWLESTLRTSKDDKLKGIVALALLKLSRVPQNELGGKAQVVAPEGLNKQWDSLLHIMRETIINGNDGLKDMSDAIEGLAYMSTLPVYKERIAKDSALIRKLSSYSAVFRSKQSLAQHDISGTIPYGLCSMITNLCAFRPRLSEEETQIARLKELAKTNISDSGNGEAGTADDSLDDDEHVRERGRLLVASGAVEILVSISRVSESPSVRLTVGKGLLSLIENKENRGKILQGGGTKTLMAIINSSQKQGKTEGDVEYSDLGSIQALAKLAITSSPIQVFGPNQTAAADAIKPLACLLLHPSSTLLQKFEALMALTNLSSFTAEMASRITESRGLLAKVEFLLLDDNNLVRRAATELICNLVSGSEIAYNSFTGEGTSDTTSGRNQAKSRLHILVALSDVDDEATRLAASGALAALTGSPTACRLLILLELENHRVLTALKQLIDPTAEDGGAAQPNAGLVHRGVVCIRNIFYNVSEESLRGKLAKEVEKRQLVPVLTKIIKGAGDGTISSAVLQPTAEALKWLMDSGVKIT